MFLNFISRGRTGLEALAIRRPFSGHVLSRGEVLDFVHERKDLFDAAAKDNPFASSAWMQHFIEQVATDDWTFFIPEYRGDGTSLMLLYARPQNPHRLQAVANFYTSLYSPMISSATNRERALGILVEQLTEMSGTSVVQLEPLAADSPDTAALERAFVRQGWHVKRYFCFGNWHLASQGMSFEDYMADRDSTLYNTWVRKAKRFQSPKAGGRLQIVTDPEEVDAAMDAYEAVYAQSWKEPESFPGFVRGWARRCAELGWLRLGLAWLKQSPVAAQLWFTAHGRANIFKLAYDERFANYSPGTILTAHMFRDCLERDRPWEIDYLTGDDGYKRTWMNARRERVGLLATNPRTWRGLILAARQVAADFSRPWRRLVWPQGNQGIASCSLRTSTPLSPNRRKRGYQTGSPRSARRDSGPGGESSCLPG